MRKKLIIKEAGFIEFIKSFFKAKSDGKEKQWISNLRKVDSELGDAWSEYDQNNDKLLQTIKKNYLQMNMPEKAAEVDKIINKYK